MESRLNLHPLHSESEAVGKDSETSRESEFQARVTLRDSEIQVTWGTKLKVPRRLAAPAASEGKRSALEVPEIEGGKTAMFALWLLAVARCLLLASFWARAFSLLSTSSQPWALSLIHISEPTRPY